MKKSYFIKTTHINMFNRIYIILHILHILYNNTYIT